MTAARKPLCRRGDGGRSLARSRERRLWERVLGRGFSTRRRRHFRGRRSLVGEFFLIAFALLWIFSLVMIGVRLGLWQAIAVLSLVVTGGVFRELLRSNRPW